MRRQQESPETSKISDSRSTNKDKSLSSSKLSKAKLTKRNNFENELIDYDKLKVLAVEKLNGIFHLKMERMFNKSWIRLVGKRNSEYNKRYGIIMIDSILKSKNRGAKHLGLRALKQYCAYTNSVRKYCLVLGRIESRFQKKFKRQTFLRFQMTLKQKREQSEAKVEQQQTPSKSIGRKPTNLPPSPSKGKKQQIVSVSEAATQPEETKKMSLSNEMRQILSELQKYDRGQLQKSLKSHLEAEIRRLEKIKNSSKSLQTQVYDNELTLNTISSLLRSMNQLIRQSRDVGILNEEKKQLQKKIIQINSQKTQELKQLRETYKSRQAEEANRVKQLDAQIKEFHKMTEGLVGLYNENNIEKTRRSLEVQIKKLGNDTNRELVVDRKQILNILLNLTAKQKPQTQIPAGPQLNIGNVTNELKLLLAEDTICLEKNLGNFSKQKRVFEARYSQSQPELRQYYEVLVALASSIHRLYSQINSKNDEGVSNSKLRRSNSGRDQKQMKQDVQAQSSKQKSKQTSRKNSYQEWVREWQEIMQQMIEGIKSGQKNWVNDISKKKRWVLAHKNNEELNRMVNTDVTLLNIIAGREREHNSYKSSPERPPSKRLEQINSEEDKPAREKVKQLSRENILLSQQVESLNGRLNIVESQSISHLQVSELEQMVYSINQILKSELKDESSYWLKLRSSFVETGFEKLNSIIECFVGLIEMIEKQLDGRAALKRQLKEIDDQITTLKASTKAFALLAQKELSEQSVDKMRRSVQSVIRRLEDSEKLYGELSSLNSLYLEDTRSKQKLLEIISNQVKMLKSANEENNEYLIRIKELDVEKDLHEKLNVHLEPMSLMDSGRRLNELMKIQSSLEEIVQEKDEGAYEKIRALQVHKNLLNDEIAKYKIVLQKYSNEQKLILQRLMEYQELLTKEKEKTKQLEHQNKQIEGQKRDLLYQLSLMENEKTVVENMLEKESMDRGEFIEQMETKDKVVRELSKDLAGCDAKIKRLQDQNQKLSLQVKDLMDKLIEVDAVNIDLVERANELEQLKQQMRTTSRQKGIKSFHDEQSSMRELQLANEIEQYRIMIQQLTKKIDQLEQEKEGQRGRIDNKAKSLEQQNQKLLIELQRTLIERQEAFKEYQQTLQRSQNEKQQLYTKLKERELQLNSVTQEMQKNSQAIGEHEQRIKESQVKLSKDIEGIVNQRLSSQEQYYKNLIETSNSSYDTIIKNQMSQIQRLNKQAAQNLNNLSLMQELQSQLSRAKFQMQGVNESKEQLKKMVQQNMEIIQLLRKSEDNYLREIQDLKNKAMEDKGTEERFKVELANQEAYFNDIINGNADIYINNEKNFVEEIERFKGYIGELQTLLRQRELTITNQSQELEKKGKQVEMLRIEIQEQIIDEQRIYKQMERLREDVKHRQGGIYTEDPGMKTKLAYLQQNEQMLRGEIDRLVQQNKILMRERDEFAREQDSKLMAESLRGDLREVQVMLGMLREEKEKAISNLKNQIEGLSVKCKQRQIQLIEQERYNASLINKFQQRERHLVQKINSTDTVNRELSNHLEIVTSQYNNLKSLINENKKLQQPYGGRENQAGSGSDELSLAERLRILSLSQNANKSGGDKSKLHMVKVKTEEGEAYQPFSLTESKEIEFDKSGSLRMAGFGYQQAQIKMSNSNSALPLEQRYFIMSQQNSSLLLKIESLQNKLHDKEMQNLKFNQHLQTMQQENRKLEIQLKRMNEKVFANEVQNVLLVDSNSGNQLKTLQGELEKMRSQNTFLKYKNDYLQNQLKMDKPKISRSASIQKELLQKRSNKFLNREEGEKMSRNLESLENSQHDLARRLNSIISNNKEQTEEDLLQISILRRISADVGQLVESNSRLIQQLRIAEKENETLYETVNKLSQGNQRQFSSAKILMSFHKMLLTVVQWLESEDIMAQEDIAFPHIEEKLQNCIKKNNPNRYIQIVEELMKSTIIEVINNREELLSEQAEQLIEMRQKLGELVNEQIQMITESEREEANEVHLDSAQKLDQVGVLLKAYSKTKNPKIMSEVEKLLYKKDKRNYY